MNTDTNINSTNQILSGQEFESIIALKTGEAPAEGQHDFRPRTYKVFRVPLALLDELKEYFDEQAQDLDSDAFDEDGELVSYNEDETLDRFLRHFVYVERTPTTYNVTVEFTVEAMSENEAEDKVNESINGWNLDWNIIETRED